MIAGDSGADCRSDGDQRRIRPATATTGPMSRSNEEDQGHRDEREALEDAERTRLDAHLELFEDRVGEQCDACQSTGEELRAEWPGEWIVVHAHSSA